MHELSIAMGIVEAATEEAQNCGVQVSAVHLRLGALSGVVKDALLFSFDVACQDTPNSIGKRLAEASNRCGPACVFFASRRKRAKRCSPIWTSWSIN